MTNLPQYFTCRKVNKIACTKDGWNLYAEHLSDSANKDKNPNISINMFCDNLGISLFDKEAKELSILDLPYPLIVQGISFHNHIIEMHILNHPNLQFSKINTRLRVVIDGKEIYTLKHLTKYQKFKIDFEDSILKQITVTYTKDDNPNLTDFVDERGINYVYHDGMVYLTYPAFAYYTVPEQYVDKVIKELTIQGYKIN